MKLTKNVLDAYVNEGWLIRQSHPTLPLSIYNYSQATQYEGKWDEVTLSCRGVITDDETGEVIVKPFSKFFNYEEIPNEVPWLSSEYVYIQDKMDGSLGILFNYRGEWLMATRGSFTSEQAIRGLEILKRNYELGKFQKAVAYICEIIYPENRIVVNYNAEKCVFLGAVLNRHFEWDASNVDELNWTTAMAYFKMSGIRSNDLVKTKQVFWKDLGHDLYKQLKSMNTPNEEGFVLRFHPSNTRVKIKFDDYVTLHRILTNVSSYDIWENLMKFDKLPETMLKDVPDEFYGWVRKTEAKLRANYKTQFNLHLAHVSSIERYGGLSAKDFALRLLQVEGINHGVAFDLYNGKNPADKIWKMIKPAYEKPFNTEVG
jgi:tRNA splicing ligase